MVEYFLVIEEGLLWEKLVLLSDRLTIGRDAANDVHLSDPSVSKHHAVVRLLKGRPVIEDLGSRNGTFVNDEQVGKGLLRSGDTIKLGNSTLRFVQKTVSPMIDEPGETRELSAEDMARDIPLDDDAPSGRILEAVSRAPLFSGFSKEQLARMCRQAKLSVFKAGKTIIRQGDRGQALHLILEGVVRVSICDNEQKEVFVSFLKEDQIFGEMSFLTGLPCSATVKAEEETLVCELRGEVIRGIASSSPRLQNALEKYYREVLKEWESRKKAAGIMERRRDARFNMALPVDLSVLPTAGAPVEVQNRVFRAESADISLCGTRVRVQDPRLLLLPMGQALRLAIFLPQSWGTICCPGILRNVSQDKGDRDVACLGVEFVEMAIADKRTLERFLTEGESPAVARILVAEDDAPMRDLLEEFLKGQGYEVALAATGEEALELAKMENPHVILLDVRMPELDGIEACMRLKKNEKTRSIPIIIVTAYEDTVVDAIEAGAEDFVNKPFQLSEIAARIRTMLRVRHLTNEMERAAAYVDELQKTITLH